MTPLINVGMDGAELEQHVFVAQPLCEANATLFCLPSLLTALLPMTYLKDLLTRTGSFDLLKRNW